MAGDEVDLAGAGGGVCLGATADVELAAIMLVGDRHLVAEEHRTVEALGILADVDRDELGGGAVGDEDCFDVEGVRESGLHGG